MISQTHSIIKYAPVLYKHRCKTMLKTAVCEHQIFNCNALYALSERILTVRGIYFTTHFDVLGISEAFAQSENVSTDAKIVQYQLYYFSNGKAIALLYFIFCHYDDFCIRQFTILCDITDMCVILKKRVRNLKIIPDYIEL